MPLSDIVSFAPHRGFGTFDNAGGGLNGDVTVASNCADIIKDTLITAGWTIDLPDSTKASGTVGFPLIVPIHTDPPTPVGGAVRLAVWWLGSAFMFYDPAAEVAPKGTVIGPDGTDFLIVAVPVGVTPDETLKNLAALMSDSHWEGSVNGGTVTVTHKTPGTEGNGTPIQGSGGNSLGSDTCSGGGWALNSSSEQSLAGGGNQMSIRLTARTGLPSTGSSGRIQFDIVMSSGVGGVLNYVLAQGSWWLITDDYQALFLVPELAGGADIFLGHNFLWVATPLLLPTAKPGVTRAAFMATDGQNPGVGSASGAAASMWVNGSYLPGGFGHRGFSFDGYRYPGPHEITDRTGKSILSRAIVAMQDPSSEAYPESRWIGVIPDAFMDSHFTPAFQSSAQEGITFRVVGSQSGFPGTSGTLWIASGEQDASGGQSTPPVTGVGNSGGSGGNGGSGSGGGGGPVKDPSNVVSATPNPLNLNAQAGASDSGTVAVNATSDTAVAVSFSTDQSWLTFSASGASVKNGSSVLVRLSGDASALTAGTYTGHLTISPAGLTTFSVAVVFTVAAGPPSSGGTGKSGVVSVFSASVVWISGDRFDNSMSTIVIAGQSYTVSSVATSGLLLFISPVGPASLQNVAYHT